MTGIFPIDKVHNRKLIKAWFHHEPSELPTDLFSIKIDDVIVGFVCVEHHNHIGLIHLGIMPGYKTREVLTKVSKMHTEYMIPILKDMGIQKVTSTCKADDTGTIRMLRAIGMVVTTYAHGVQIID